MLKVCLYIFIYAEQQTFSIMTLLFAHLRKGLTFTVIALTEFK